MTRLPLFVCAVLACACEPNAYCALEAERAEDCGRDFDREACEAELQGCRTRDQVDLVAYSNCLRAEGIGVCETCAPDAMLVACDPTPVPDPALPKVQEAVAVCGELLADDLSTSCQDELFPSGCSTSGAAPGGLVWLILLVLGGCGFRDATNRCTPQFFVDEDGDGFGDPATQRTRCDGSVRGLVQIGGDCDDTDPTRYPGAPEVCDGIDNDCDDVLDEELRDQDRDGVSICDGDCDDLDPWIKPGAPERCNGLDDDCDGELERPTPGDDVDGDGDGFTFCEGDCDDTNADVRPDVPRDDCDGLDSDCNGFIDDVVDPLEPNDLPEQAVVITGTGQHQGLFSHDGDPVDIVRIVASEATSIRIALFDLAVRVRVVDASGDEIAREENDATIRLELPDPTASPFLLFVEPLGPPGCDGSYSVSAEPSR